MSQGLGNIRAENSRNTRFSSAKSRAVESEVRRLLAQAREVVHAAGGTGRFDARVDVDGFMIDLFVGYPTGAPDAA